MDCRNYFKNKKITAIGLGLLGRGVGDTLYLAECGAELIVTDLKSEAELAESLEKLKDFKNISYTLGEHKIEDFKGRDMVLVAAGVPLDSEYVTHAVKDGARKVQSAALFAELTEIPLIGITGTRGKSTTSQMIHHVLSVVNGENIILGGTVRGVSNLQLLKEVKEDSIAVFELDSWQLQGFGWAEISPQIAVFTNFMEDHMDYYNDDMNVYFKDKDNIFLYQEESGVFITTPDVLERAQKLKGVTLQQKVVLVDGSAMREDVNLKMPGEHNRMNAALAYEALKAVNLSDEEICEGLVSFAGVEGRLQYMKEVNGVKIYNDNNATTPAATVAGLKAVADGKNVILIAGGHDKKLPLEPLLAAIKTHVKQVVLIPGIGTDKLLELLDACSTINRNIVASTHQLGGKTAKLVGDLRQAVEEARSAADTGDVILFSPAFASFGEYANEYDRGDQFMNIVNTL